MAGTGLALQMKEVPISIEELVSLIFWATMGYIYAEGLWYIACGLHHLYRQRSSSQ